jgi:hypothetical protein
MSMKLYSSTIDALRRFVDRYHLPGVAGKRTYVFIFVPFDFRKSGRATQTEAPRSLIDYTQNGGCDRLASFEGPDIAGKYDDGDGSGEDLNFELMWTWFLPNPLWPPKKSK